MAEKLRDAGYPQPEPSEYGLGWYWAKIQNKGPLIYSLAELWLFEPYSIHMSIYAPTATELIPMGWARLRHKEIWICCSIEDGRQVFASKNPHDAAAMAWLHEKKPVLDGSEPIGEETADEYLDRLVKEAAPAWEGVDPEKFLAEARGRVPFDEAIRLLRALADLQNGPTLEKYREEWEALMRDVAEFLKTHEA